MTDLQTDTLLKPDMGAVLSRTHLQVNVHGFLLPIFEAISNAMHGVEERFGEEAKSAGVLHISFRHWNNPTKIIITVSDNGSGLNDDNFKSFKTPFSGYKLKQKGRGFGRFIAFKVFNKVVYQSRYEFFKNETTRSFRFDIGQDSELIFVGTKPSFSGPGVCVEYGQPLTNWHDLIRELNADDIANEIGAHFLPYFLYKWLPQITIQFDDETPIDIRSRFGAMFVQFDDGSIECIIDGNSEKLTYSLARIARTSQFKSHCSLLSAADRIVGTPRDLTNKIGQPYFSDENENKYVAIAVVRGDAFESRLNDARTGINLGPRVIEQIVSEVSDVIQSKEHDQID